MTVQCTHSAQYVANFSDCDDDDALSHAACSSTGTDYTSTSGATMVYISAGADPHSCPGYRLPTEGEWEYAARAGVDTRYSGSDTIGDVAWYDVNSGSTTHEGCMLAETAWGWCDMSGNVWEWTNDWYSSSYGGYGTGAASADPPGASSGSTRVGRGGGWSYGANYASVSNRYNDYPEDATSYFGFRLSRSIVP